MATLKNPSIYDDRSTIGSADELDQYGVWVKIEPEELLEAGESSFSGFDDDFEPELPPLEVDDALFEDFDYSGAGGDLGFDDVEALRQDIQSSSMEEPAGGLAAEPAMPASALAPPAGPSSASMVELSPQALMKIVDALSAIKDELSAIKKAVAALRSEKPAREDRGFFGNDEDDKIALTGDELDNIIQTAALTGETGIPGEEAPESPGAGGEILYDGLGRPLNRNISGDDLRGEDDISLDTEADGALKALQESGIEPMTMAPEDTSYLEEDPLVEEDLNPPSIEEQDLDGIGDTNPDEPALEDLSLIDLETIAPPPAVEEERIEEKPLFEDVNFEDLPDLNAPLDSEDTMALGNFNGEEIIDLSVFEDDFLLAEDNAAAEDSENSEELSFEALDEDTDLPVQENIQDNVITEDSFESISLEDDGEIADLTFDQDLEQTLPGDIDMDLDFPLVEGEIAQDPGEDDKNFDLPGSAATADAGDPAISAEEVPAAIRMELKDVLVYMDRLLEALPEEKINEFAQSEHYTTYKKLFEELGIQQ
jgi:hypothetical protein